MAATQSTLMTHEDLLKLPREQRCELLKGEQVPVSPTSLQHGEIVIHLGSMLLAYLRERPLPFKCVTEVGFVLERNPDTLRAPDLALVSIERAPTGVDATKFVQGHPDLAIEIVSSRDAIKELETKSNDYLRAGCRMVWIIDGLLKTVTVKRAATDINLFVRDDLLEVDDVLPGFNRRVADLFPPTL